MKNSILFIALILVLSQFILGCDDNNGTKSTVLTENDFSENSSLRANPKGGIIATLLEHPDTEEVMNDTDGVGMDEIPIAYQRTVEQTFCWEDDDPDAMHFMELLDSQENVVMNVVANSECVSEIITPGEYVMSFNHDGKIERPFAIFSEPVEPDSEQTRKTDGLIDKLKTLATNFLNGIQNTVIDEAQAQSVQENVLRLLYTNSCVGCDLSGANLIRFNLDGANLTEANLTEANLSMAVLEDAILLRANLTDATLLFTALADANLENAVLVHVEVFDSDFSYANLRGANLERANLVLSFLAGADLTDVNMSRANLGGTDLSDAILFEANMTGAGLGDSNLIGADLTGANLSLARWCNGCECHRESIGTCVGCPPVEEVCTGN